MISKNRKSSAMFGQGKIYMTPDLENDDCYLSIWESLHADQAFRITVDGEMMGCLVVDADHASTLSNVQKKLVAMLASLAGIALKKDRLFGLAEKITQQVITLNTIGEVVGNTKSVDELLHLIAKECLCVVERPNKAAKILLWDRERDKLIVRAARGEEFGKMEMGASLSVQERSLITWVLRNRQPRYAANVLDDPEYRPQNASVRSEIAVPLRFQDEILGVVDVQSTQLDDFNLQDQQSLSAVANSAAIAIKIVELTGTRLRELKALYRIGTKISSTLNANEVMQTVCHEGLKAIGSENRAMTVHVLHPENRQWITSLTLEASLNFKGPERNRCREDDTLQWIAGKKDHVLIPDVKAQPSYKPVAREIKSAMLVPIRFDDRLIGLIQVESRREDDFGEGELKLMSGLANQAGAALENARLSQDLTKTQMHLSRALETAAIEEALAGLTHDIKNISSLIAGETQWLKRCQRQNQLELNKEVNSAIQNIHSYVKRVEEITNNLKRPVDKPLLEFKTVNLGTLIDEAFELIASRAVRNHVEVVKDDSTSKIRLRVDAGRMIRAFFNIMSNAIDAMQDGGSLTIMARQNRNSVEIDFADTGPGIPAEILNKVMSPLFSTKSEGYGLGLALSKRIVETDHQGKLTLKSKEGQGTTVCIKLPAKEATKQSGQTKKRSVKSRRSKPAMIAHSDSNADMCRRVLVVNDELDMLNKIKWKLQTAGYSVTGTEYGRDAIHICNRGQFDAILMDYHLKKDTGRSCTAFDFIPAIRNTLPTTPIILTSASLREKPAGTGMFDYFLEINAAFWDDVLPLI
ncbi:MAG: GAF domain-containing protein, partial [bacterium]